MMPSSALLLPVLVLLLADSVVSRIYDRCDLARELVQKHKFQRKHIADWICLIRHESEYKTDAVGRLNADGSIDYGLFQISGKFWCNSDGFDGACGINCSDLLDDNIKDDAVCARRVFRNHAHLNKSGFDAWVAWKQHCEGQDVESYIRDCDI